MLIGLNADPESVPINRRPPRMRRPRSFLQITKLIPPAEIRGRMTGRSLVAVRRSRNRIAPTIGALIKGRCIESSTTNRHRGFFGCLIGVFQLHAIFAADRSRRESRSRHCR